MFVKWGLGVRLKAVRVSGGVVLMKFRAVNAHMGSHLPRVYKRRTGSSIWRVLSIQPVPKARV